MDILTIIDKKRKGYKLTKDELSFAFLGYLNEYIKDYQMSSLLMAITIRGMDLEETIDLTDIMLNSGVVLKGIENQVDKHSTGGVGDKTSMIIGPILASLGLKMGKLSGRGLGFTGGTIDKLESIPGFNVDLTKEKFTHNMKTVGFVECSQTDDFTPLDKVIYALRSVSGTTESIPLIASSIMSKKLAIGAKHILIDIKVGEGALMKTRNDAYSLGEMLVNIGKHYDVTVIPVLSDMDTPLGDAIGNALEVKEAIEVLNGKKGPLRDLCVYLSSTLYSNVTGKSLEDAKKDVEDVLDNKAYSKFLEFVKAQGGDINKLKVSSKTEDIYSDRDGIIESISAYKIGMLSLHLGGGRLNKGEKIDYGVGVVLNRHLNDKVKKGDLLLTIYKRDDKSYSEEALKAFQIN